MADLAHELKQVIAEIIEKDPGLIADDARFAEDLGVDSMMALEILAAIEKKYKIQIPEDKLMEMSTFSKTLAIAREYLEKKQNASA